MTRQHDQPVRRIDLLKQAQRWSFTVAPGDEETLRDALPELVGRSSGALDWFDAAVICLELGPGPVR